jgi:hypothetical protein
MYVCVYIYVYICICVSGPYHISAKVLKLTAIKMNPEIIPLCLSSDIPMNGCIVPMRTSFSIFSQVKIPQATDQEPLA